MTALFNRNLLLLAVFVLGSCTSSKKDNSFSITFKSLEGEPLAQVGNLTFSVEELKEDFQERQGTFRGAANLNTDKARSDYLDTQVTQEAMFQKAVSMGLQNKLSVKRNIKKIIVEAFMREELDKAQTNFVASEEMIKEHYEKNPNLYNREEAIKVGYIAIPFEADQAKAKQAATMIHKKALATIKTGNAHAFAKVPMEMKDELGKMGISTVETNETDYLAQSEFDKKFGVGSFQSIKNSGEVGQVGNMAMVDNNYIITMKTGYRKALNESLEDAKEKITKRLSYEHRGDYYKKLTENLK